VVARQGAQAGSEAGWSSPALWIVAVAGFSDVLDGFLARRWGLVTRFGALLDAVADKSFQFTTLVTITLLGRPLFSQLPIWLLGAVFLRDLVLLTGWLFVRRMKRPVDLEHQLHGRMATVLVFLLVVGSTVGWSETALAPAAALAALAALLSAAAYIRRGMRLARSTSEAQDPRAP
jgi:cardiolipin synthase